MASQYKLTIPQNAGELEDHLGWMVLAGPEFETGLPGRDIDAAFEELELGLLKVIKGPKLSVLQNMTAEMRRCFEAGELKRAIELSDEMSLMVREKSIH